jgi:signal transduction histidine kinase
MARGTDWRYKMKWLSKPNWFERPLSLRTRIAGAMLALVTVTAILVAVIAHFTVQRMEENANYDLLAEELLHYEQRLRANPTAEPLRSAALHIYRSSDLSELPRDIARLKPGIYRSVRRDGRSWRVLVRDSEFGRFYITYDVTDLETAQNIALSVLIAGVIGALALTTWAAFRLSRQLVDPIHRFADRLAHIDPSNRQIRIADEFTDNELAPIARSVDMFLERLDGFVEREQSFTSTASHELRTPLAVIQGAVELLSGLKSDATTSTTAQAPLARIERAVREMSEFTTALLNLAREPERQIADDHSCDVVAAVRRSIEDQRSSFPGKRVIFADGAQPIDVAAPESMISMVAGNILRNALQHGADTEIRCAFSDRTLVVTNAGEIAPQNLPHLFKPRFTTGAGHGMGLYIARRICERYGWHLNIESNAAGTRTTCTF